MDFKSRIISATPIYGDVDSNNYYLSEGVEFTVQSQSIDKLKWFVFIPQIEKFDYIEKYYFDFLINKYVTYPQYYGEFQLPVISDDVHSFAVVTPSGYVTWVNKEDVGVIGGYTNMQHLSSDEVRFR